MAKTEGVLKAEEKLPNASLIFGLSTLSLRIFF